MYSPKSLPLLYRSWRSIAKAACPQSDYGPEQSVNPIRSLHGALNHVFAKTERHSSSRQAARHSASNGVNRATISAPFAY